MSDHANPPKTVRVTLAPHEGEQLFVFLYEQIHAGAEQTRFSDLDALLEKLDHANALAAWLRESVKLELEAHEVASVLETLEDLSRQTSQTLVDVRDKLQNCQPGLSCVGKSN